MATLRSRVRGAGDRRPPGGGKQVVIYSANESTLDGLVFAAFEKETGIKI